MNINFDNYKLFELQSEEQVEEKKKKERLKENINGFITDEEADQIIEEELYKNKMHKLKQSMRRQEAVMTNKQIILKNKNKKQARNLRRAIKRNQFITKEDFQFVCDHYQDFKNEDYKQYITKINIKDF